MLPKWSHSIDQRKMDQRGTTPQRPPSQSPGVPKAPGRQRTTQGGDRLENSIPRAQYPEQDRRCPGPHLETASPRWPAHCHKSRPHQSHAQRRLTVQHCPRHSKHQQCRPQMRGPQRPTHDHPAACWPSRDRQRPTARARLGHVEIAGRVQRHGHLSVGQLDQDRPFLTVRLRMLHSHRPCDRQARGVVDEGPIQSGPA